MKRGFFMVLCLIAMFCRIPSVPRFETRGTDGMRWFKGNMHTHARQGESDTTVGAAGKWYKDHGYNFLVITDHSIVTFPEELSSLADSSFLPIPGEEVIGRAKGVECEINALNILSAVPPRNDSTVSGALQRCIDAARRENAVPVINHPNFQWRLDGKTILAAERCVLFEVYNAFPGVGNEGDSGHPGLEQVWDFLLTSGKRMYGVAADDAHAYREFSPELSNPGRGWVMVRAKRLDAKEIMQGLEAGLFYSSTGVEIEDIRVEPSRIEIIPGNKSGRVMTTEFIGSGGKTLAVTKSDTAVYRLRPGDTYVRARITDPGGSRAWIQPVFVVH
jgi:hypothetical protein